MTLDSIQMFSAELRHPPGSQRFWLAPGLNGSSLKPGTYVPANAEAAFAPLAARQGALCAKHGLHRLYATGKRPD